MGFRTADESRVRTETVLVVDDDADVLAVTGEMLALGGYSVHKIKCPKEAIRFFEDGARIDLVLSDVDMPELTGPEMARLMWLRCPGLPVVFMSGADCDAVPDGALSKPFRTRELWERIADALRGAPGPELVPVGEDAQ